MTLSPFALAYSKAAFTNAAAIPRPSNGGGTMVWFMFMMPSDGM